MPELVSVPISFFEFVIDYQRPEFLLWMNRASIVQEIFDALKPWDPHVDDVEVLSVGKASEQGVSLKLPLKQISFFFGPASCKLTRDNANWSTAKETLDILAAAVSSLTLHSAIKVAAQKAAIAMHVQPQKLHFTDILRPFVAGQLASLEAEPVTTMAAVARWSSRKITIDGSGALANGIFLRLERDFPSSTSYPDIARQLRKDQDDLFEVLGVEEVQG